jgi:hypothetical protein
MKEHAFPSPVDPKTGTNQLGITVRDYFAAMAMQAYLTNPKTMPVDSSSVYTASYFSADAMMEARK